MERLIVVVGHGDFDYYEETLPAVYESKEKFLSDFEAKLLEIVIDKKGELTYDDKFSLGGVNFTASDFYHVAVLIYGKKSGRPLKSHEIFNLPEVYTLDEFFASVEKPA